MVNEAVINPEFAIELIERGYRPDLASQISKEDASRIIEEKLVREKDSSLGVILSQGPYFFGAHSDATGFHNRMSGKDLIFELDSELKYFSLDPTLDPNLSSEAGFSLDLKDSQLIRGSSSGIYWDVHSLEGKEKGRLHAGFGENNSFFLVPKGEVLLANRDETYKLRTEPLRRLWNTIGNYLNLEMQEVPEEERSDSEKGYGNPVYTGTHKNGSSFRFGTRKRVHLFSGSLPQRIPTLFKEEFDKKLEELVETYRSYGQQYPSSLEENQHLGGHIGRGNGGRFIYRVAKEMVETQDRLYN